MLCFVLTMHMLADVFEGIICSVVLACEDQDPRLPGLSGSRRLSFRRRRVLPVDSHFQHLSAR